MYHPVRDQWQALAQMVQALRYKPEGTMVSPCSLPGLRRTVVPLSSGLKSNLSKQSGLLGVSSTLETVAEYASERLQGYMLHGLVTCL